MGCKAKDVLSKRITLFVSFLLMFVFAAIRKDIGVDYVNYQNWYRTFSIGSHLTREVEFGYLFLNNFCIATGLGFEGLIVIASFLCYYPVYYLAKQLNKPLVLYIYFLLLYPISFALIRQCIAISIALICTYLYLKQYFPDSPNNKHLLLKKKDRLKLAFPNKKLIILVVLSCSFHYSLVLYFLLLFSTRFFTLKTRETIPLLLIVALIGFNSNAILEFVTNHFADGMYARYFEKGSVFFTGRKLGSGLGVVLRYIIYVVSFAFISILLNKRTKQEKGFFNLMFLFLVGLDALSFHSEIFIRFKFLSYVVFFIPLFFLEKFSKRTRTAYYAQVCCSVILLLYLLLFKYYNDLNNWKDIPYQSLFF